jgi:hypothetical protein
MRVALAYAGGELEAEFDGEIWVVRLGLLEETSPYIDYALSRLLDTETQNVHHLAAQLIEAVLLEAQAPETVAVKPTN